MKYLANERSHDDSGNESSDKSQEQRYREAVQLDLFQPEDLPMLKRVLAFLKELGRSPNRS